MSVTDTLLATTVTLLCANSILAPKFLRKSSNGYRSRVTIQYVCSMEKQDPESDCTKYLRTSRKTAQPQPAGTSTSMQHNALAVSFFFNRQEENRCSTELVVATIAYQLASSDLTLERLICDALNNIENVLTTASENQLQQLIIESMQSLCQPYLV